VSGHSWHYCPSCGPRWWRDSRAHGDGAGGCGCCWTLRGGVSASCEGARYRRCALRVGPTDSADRRRSHVVLSDKEFIARVRALAPEGIDHIVEVAFGVNIEADVELLKLGGSIATYATDNAAPKIPFWQMVFKNSRVFFLGSDDFPKEAKLRAAQDLNIALEAGWSGFEISERIPLADIARAHELVEHPMRPGRVVILLTPGATGDISGLQRSEAR